MRLATLCLAWAALLLAAAPAAAQYGPPFPNPGAPQPASTVQLPTFGFTTVTTTVSVPDGGTALLGGVDRLSEGRTERGVPVLGHVPYLDRLFRNQGIGRNVSGSTISATVRIINLEEEEERQVGRPLDDLYGLRTHDLRRELPGSGEWGDASGYADVGDPAERRARELSRHVARTEHFEPVRKEPAAAGPSADEIRRRNEAEAVARADDVATFYDKARQAAAEGKVGAARVYFQMAARRAEGPLKDEILAQLAALSRAGDGPAVASSP